ncbi:MAG: transcriptional regulator, partial [Deltaproteobacteria bacterium]|nr:transcriptional regulator [Deltaproteobacteria bacterium]
PAPARAGAGQAASDRAGIPGALEETQHRGPLPQLRPAWSPGGGTGGRLALALLVGAVVGVAGVWGFNTVFPPAEAGTPSAQARPTGAPLPARTAATTTATATQSPATAAVETAAAEPAALKVLGKPQTAGLPPAGAAPAATPPPAAPPATAAAPAATPPPAAKPAPAAPPPAPPPASKPAPVAPPPAPKPAPKPASKPASGDDYE